MKLLIVDDDGDFAIRLVERLSGLEPSIDATIAASRSSGIDALRRYEFDFIVCDLRLPPDDGGVDIDEAHGLAVHSEARSVCPGTPCLFFTGFGTGTNVGEQLSHSGAHDILGTGTLYGMARLLKKDEFLECVERIKSFHHELQQLNSINIRAPDDSLILDETEQRALRLLTRTLGGASIEASPLGGRSGARTMQASIKDDQGRVRASFFSKIGTRAKLQQERNNYHEYVSPLLKMGTYPALARQIEAGIGKREALFYQLADRHSRSLFDVLGVDETAAIAIVDNLRDIFAPWEALQDNTVVRMGFLRAQKIDDSIFQPFRSALGISIDFEEIEREIKTSYQHGDLHGFNVLCDEAGDTVVIDFGNAGHAPACLDPVLLELSILFHSDSPFRNGSWPTVEQAEECFNLEEYLLGCPVPEFVRRCREWANEAGGAAGLPPVVYAEAVRQLKYSDTRHDWALAIARAAIRKAHEFTC